mmetsp:Transcript_44685/g.136332  ORF Transcript_44685/g.136332 Transcript_44685/m.136332 type:complete len:212 (+) Transcript_44685:922-1557(+)
MGQTLSWQHQDVSPISLTAGLCPCPTWPSWYWMRLIVCLTWASNLKYGALWKRQTCPQRSTVKLFCSQRLLHRRSRSLLLPFSVPTFGLQWEGLDPQSRTSSSDLFSPRARSGRSSGSSSRLSLRRRDALSSSFRKSGLPRGSRINCDVVGPRTAPLRSASLRFWRKIFMAIAVRASERRPCASSAKEQFGYLSPLMWQRGDWISGEWNML